MVSEEFGSEASPGEATLRAECELGQRQLRRLMKGDGAREELPSGRAWMKRASKFAGPQELLDALREGELLPLGNVCCQILLEGQLLMAPERAVRRAQVQVAVKSRLYPGRGDFAAWLRVRCLAGILDGLDAELEDEEAGRPVSEEQRGEFAIFRELFGIDPGRARAVMLRFAALPELPRRLVFEIVARGRALTAVASEVGVSVEETEREFGGALARIGVRGTAPAPFKAPWRERLDQMMFEGEI